MHKFFVLLCAFLLFAAEIHATSAERKKIKDLPFNDSAVQRYLKSYYLPHQHPMRPILDEIFSRSHPLANKQTFAEAGFITLLTKRAGHCYRAHWRLAKHPKIPGYLFKIYLDSETKLRDNEGWMKLATRCEGAENVRTLIKKKKLRHFIVPDKWLYKVPCDPLLQTRYQEVILMVTDMDIVSKTACREAWKQANQEQLDELFCILKHGFASTYLIGNVCYTRSGKFACLDTEIARRTHHFSAVMKYLSPEMQRYWEHLMEGLK